MQDIQVVHALLLRKHEMSEDMACTQCILRSRRRGHLATYVDRSHDRRQGSYMFLRVVLSMGGWNRKIVLLVLIDTDLEVNGTKASTIDAGRNGC